MTPIDWDDEWSVADESWAIFDELNAEYATGPDDELLGCPESCGLIVCDHNEPNLWT